MLVRDSSFVPQDSVVLHRKNHHGNVEIHCKNVVPRVVVVMRLRVVVVVRMDVKIIAFWCWPLELVVSLDPEGPVAMPRRLLAASGGRCGVVAGTPRLVLSLSLATAKALPFVSSSSLGDCGRFVVARSPLVLPNKIP